MHTDQALIEELGALAAHLDTTAPGQGDLLLQAAQRLGELAEEVDALQLLAKVLVETAMAAEAGGPVKALGPHDIVIMAPHRAVDGDGDGDPTHPDPRMRVAMPAGPK